MRSHIKQEVTDKGYVERRHGLTKEADVSAEPDYRGPANNNDPDPLDNLGALGENILFVDGHVEFVKQRKYIYSYELGGDEGRSGP
ncbi:MAG: hypothetical protein HYY24_12620 [Verrucomicrobia bacterium]|nr:hypothetical protein [Verrucomicrobiota bacterium]